MAIHIREEANRCLQCKKPMCQAACPVGTEIPQIIQLFKENRTLEAGEKLFANNPMSVICAMVCNHEAQCFGHCVLGRKGTPVQFYEIEKYISDTYLDRMLIPPVEKKGKSVAVIGSGPAGMTAAIILARNGYEVTIFEERCYIGGMLYYGIPEFRLPKSILHRYQDRMVEMGIHIRPNTTISDALNIDMLFRDGYAAVMAGTGVWRPKTLGIRGESLPNVHFGISYLTNPTAFSLGETVAIIGMGNVAMDVARTALRHGARKVTMYARSRHIAASSEEVQFAELDGAELVFGKAIDHFAPEGPVFRTAILNEDGKVTGYEEELDAVQADSTIIAVSQGPKDRLLLTTEGLKKSETGMLKVDEDYMTTVPGVFAAGDVVTGSYTVVSAVQQAKKAAEGIMKYIEKEAVKHTDL